MPTYEYVCRACGHEFEEFQSIKADPISVCPKCRKKKVERKIGLGGAVIFKGGGFYETDYRSESYKSGADAEKKANEPANDSGSATTEKKSNAHHAANHAETTAANAPANSPAKPASMPSASSDASLAATEKKRIEDRATHHSRIGRGIGNVVKKSTDAARGNIAKPSKASTSAKSAKTPKKSSRK